MELFVNKNLITTANVTNTKCWTEMVSDYDCVRLFLISLVFTDFNCFIRIENAVFIKI